MPGVPPGPLAPPVPGRPDRSAASAWPARPPGPRPPGPRPPGHRTAAAAARHLAARPAGRGGSAGVDEAPLVVVRAAVVDADRRFLALAGDAENAAAARLSADAEAAGGCGRQVRPHRPCGPGRPRRPASAAGGGPPGAAACSRRRTAAGIRRPRSSGPCISSAEISAGPACRRSADASPGPSSFPTGRIARTYCSPRKTSSASFSRLA